MNVRHEIPDLLLIEPRVFEDSRGYIFESFNSRGLNEGGKSTYQFVQDNHHGRYGMFCGACIIKSGSRRGSWFEWCAAKFLMWRSTFAELCYVRKMVGVTLNEQSKPFWILQGLRTVSRDFRFS